MKSDYNRASADMSPRTLTEIRRGAPAKKSGWRLSVLYLERPAQSSKLTQSEIEQARLQALRYFRR